MDSARISWTGKRQFIGTDGAGHSVVMDATDAYGGEGSGIRPLEMVLHGLAACTGMDVVSILEKKRQDVRGLEIRVNAQQVQDGYPRIYSDIELEYIVTGFGVAESAVARAIELSEEKYCSVKGMLGPQVTVRTSFKVLDADTPHGCHDETVEE